MSSNTTNDHTKVLRQVTKALGNDAIIVWNPKEVGYHITSSTLRPGQTKEILENLLQRFNT